MVLRMCGLLELRFKPSNSIRTKVLSSDEESVTLQVRFRVEFHFWEDMRVNEDREGYVTV